MTTRRAAVMALIAALVAPCAARAKVSWKKTTKPYPGVVVREGRTGNNKNDVYAATISLCTSQVHVASTTAPSSMATPGSWASKVGVQLAVNGDFFTWSCGKPQIYGDAVGGSKRWPACQRGNDASHAGAWYHKKNGWIAFGKDWVEFSNSKAVKSKKLGNYGWYPQSVTTSLPSGVKALVSGFSQLVIDGKPVTCSSPTASSCFSDRSDLRQRHPRTAMGLSKDRRTFILAVVDGRTSASIGMYGTELAALMAELGAWTAFNLDGGGSSAMWVKGQGYVNNPSDGSARAVANHWGIYAGSAGGKSATPGSCFTAGACFPTRVIGAETSLFKDMPQSWTGYAQAKLLQQKKIVSGCRKSPDLMFCPKCAITRRQMVAFLVRAAKISAANPPAKPTFTDVSTSAADYAIIEAAAKAGLTKGCGSGKFCPDSVVTRSTGAVFTVRAAGYALVSPAKASFSDVSATHSRYKYIETLKDRCVASGYSDGTFRPDEPLPRSHAAIWTVKALNLDGKNSCLKELCNGKDDDFDGTVDEGCACKAGQTRPCGSDVGACVAGTQSCAKGAWSACAGAVGPVAELCNGVDDDCDGQTDEACLPAGDGGVDGGSGGGDGGSSLDRGADLPPTAPGGDAAPGPSGGGCAVGPGGGSPGTGALLLALLGALALARRRRSRLTLQAVARVVVPASLLLACGDLPPEAEGPPEGIDSVSQALSSINCTESSGTGYVKGKAFSIKLVTVDGKKMEVKTANAYYVMAQAAAKAGVNLKVVSGFRTMAQQTYLYNCYKTCSCNNCNLAATPGYSNHQSGHAVDLNTSAAGVYSWLKAHGGAYGFKKTVPSESWHWEWWGGGPGGGPCGKPTYPKLTIAATIESVAGQARDLCQQGSSAKIFDLWEGQQTALFVDVKNKGSAVGREVTVKLELDQPQLEVQRWNIYSDYKKAGSFALNDTDGLQSIPHKLPGKAFKLWLASISPGETKRIKLTLKGAAGSLDQPGHPALRAWVSKIQDYYAKASYAAAPSKNVKSYQTQNGGELRTRAQLDVLAQERCDGVDNDCSGAADEGCNGDAGGADAGGGDAGAGDAGGGDAGTLDADEADGGVGSGPPSEGCAVGGRGGPSAALPLAALLLLLGWRRRRADPC